jgi:hypothetical protein
MATNERNEHESELKAGVEKPEPLKGIPEPGRLFQGRPVFVFDIDTTLFPLQLGSLEYGQADASFFVSLRGFAPYLSTSRAKNPNGRAAARSEIEPGYLVRRFYFVITRPIGLKSLTDLTPRIVRHGGFHLAKP